MDHKHRRGILEAMGIPIQFRNQIHTARQRAIASEGGKAAHERGTAHEFTSEEARRAGSMSHGNRQSASTSSKTKGDDGNVRPVMTRTFQTLSQAEEENGQSRIYLGIHWSFDKTEGIAQGRRAGVLSVLGISTGSVMHTLMAALGLSVIIGQSPMLFSIVKWAGAVYVAYIGFQMLLQKSTLDFHAAETGGQTTKDSRIFRDAMVTNLLNPKVALFFIAFLPQFVQPSHAGTFLPFLLLGLTFAFLGMLWCLVLATSAATISAKLRADSRLSFLLNKICGTALLGLSISIAFAKK